MASLPPDLDRLGEHLARAAGDTLAVRRRRREQRRRVLTAVLAGALAFVALTPADLGRAVRELTGTQLVASTIPNGCEHLHGVGAMPARCVAAEAAVSHRPYAWR